MDDDQFKVGPDLQGRTWTYTLHKSDGVGWDVDCWNEDDSNHFHRHFLKYDQAKAEFERWRK